MRWLFSFLVLALLGAVQALSSSGSRLLVILEEESERENYSVLLEDLSSKYLVFMCYLQELRFNYLLDLKESPSFSI